MPQKVQYIKNNYPAASGFYSFILKKMVIGDIDIFNKKSRQTRWNWAWDYEVCCFISEKAVQTGQMLLIEFSSHFKLESGGQRHWNLYLYVE